MRRAAAGRASRAAADDKAKCTERPLLAAVRNRLLSPIVRARRAQPRPAFRGAARARHMPHLFSPPFSPAAHTGCLTRACVCLPLLPPFRSFILVLRPFSHFYSSSSLLALPVATNPRFRPPQPSFRFLARGTRHVKVRREFVCHCTPVWSFPRACPRSVTTSVIYV